MSNFPVEERRRLISLWLVDRLADPRAVLWTIDALERKKGLSNDDLLELLKEIAQYAEEASALETPVKTVWRLLFRAAREMRGRVSRLNVAQLHRRMCEGRFQYDNVDELIDCVRPRLKVSKPRSYQEMDDTSANDPKHWAQWSFEAASGTVGGGGTITDLPALSSVPAAVLVRLLVAAAAALDTAIDIGRDVGWITGSIDVLNGMVARAAFDKKQDEAADPTADNDGDGQGDPDKFNDSFAPIVRLITAGAGALASLDPSSVRRFISSLEGREAGLFLRVQASLGLHQTVWDGDAVGRFLLRLPELPFWRWMAYPEIATLRATRWEYIPPEPQEGIVRRLIAGPSRGFLGEAASDHADDNLRYWQDHEIARVVDNNEHAPAHMRQRIAERRQADQDFPKNVPRAERGRGSLKASRVPDGDPKALSGIAEENLIQDLAAATKNRPFGEGDNAQAYARENRMKLAQLLATRNRIDDDTLTVWRLVLSYPHDKAEDANDGRKTAEFIASTAVEMPQGLFDEVADRLCYWLDVVDEALKGFKSADELWQRLLPTAGRLRNADPLANAAAQELDLSHAGLNAPLGHLISYFFRRCPTMPRAEPRPPLPGPFVDALKRLKGHARLLLAGRVCLAADYFWLADHAWLNDLALQPMHSESAESTALWETFAKYAQLPRPSLWRELERKIFDRIRQVALSVQAARRLTEMSVLAWVMSKKPEAEYQTNALGLRNALSNANHDIRSAAAWQFYLLIKEGDSADETESDESDADSWSRLGPTFFEEIWPLEPGAQAAGSAKHFARIPARAGANEYAAAVQTLLAYLRPFEVWDAHTEFGLDPSTDDFVREHPYPTLALISASVSSEQGHRIYRLRRILSLIVQAKPEIGEDPRFRRLSRLAADESE